MLRAPHRVGCTVAVGLLALWFATAASTAQAAEEPAVDLSAALEKARGGLTPITAADVRREAQPVAAKLKRLRDWLAPQGANGQAWEKYLLVADLEAQLKQDQPDLETVRKVYDRFRSGKPGLEMEYFHDVPQAMRTWIETAEAAASPATAEEYTAQLDKLAALLKDMGDAPSAEQSAELNSVVEWLQKHRQAPELVAALRQRYSQPNLLVEISEKFIASGIERPVDQTGPVRDFILGTTIRGTARTVGKVTVELVQNAGAAVIEAVMNATNYSRSTGYSGPARVFTRGETRLIGRKRLSITPEGISSETAVATADLDSRITGYGSSKGGFIGKIIRKGAAKRAPQKQYASSRIAEQHAEERLVDQLEERIKQPLADANRDFLERFRYPLMRRGRFPQSLRLATTNDRLLTRAVAEAFGRLAAPLAPPSLKGEQDVAFRMHESLVNNVTLEVLAGQTVSNHDLEDMAVETLGYIPDKLKESSSEAWSITFNAEEPIRLHIDGNTVVLTVHGDGFSSGEKTYEAMDVTARYTLELSDAGLKGTRPEQLEIFPPGFDPGSGQRLPLRVTVLRSLLQRRFGDMLPQEFVVDEIELEEPWDKQGPLRITQMEADHGWLLLAAQPADTMTAAGQPSGTDQAATK